MESHIGISSKANLVGASARVTSLCELIALSPASAPPRKLNLRAARLAKRQTQKERERESRKRTNEEPEETGDERGS